MASTPCHNIPVSKRLLVLLIILVFILGLGGGYAISKFSLLERIGLIASSEEEPGACEESDKAEEEEVVEEIYTCEGQIYTNTNQGYKVCYSTGWYTQVFESPKKIVGFDPNPIPEASEYGGVFMISISSKSVADLKTQYSADIVSPTTVTDTVDGVSGVRLSGTISSDSAFFPNYHEVFTMVKKFNRTYVIQLLSSPSSYAANLTLYNEFVNSFRFLNSAASPL